MASLRSSDSSLVDRHRHHQMIDNLDWVRLLSSVSAEEVLSLMYVQLHVPLSPQQGVEEVEANPR